MNCGTRCGTYAKRCLPKKGGCRMAAGKAVPKS